MTLVPWLVLIALTAANALYVAAEFAAVSVQRSQLARAARAGNARAQGMLAVVEKGEALDRYIAACQIGITLTSLVAGAYAQATLTVALWPALGRALTLPDVAAQGATAAAVLIGLTTFQVVLGELVPKAVALRRPLETALLTYLPTHWSTLLYSPFIFLFNGSAMLFLRPLGVDAAGHQHVHSPGEIEFLLAESRASGTVSPELHRRLERGLHLSTRTVRQLMVPRNKLVAIEASTPAEELVQLLRQSPYSRLPVYRDNLDQVLGAVSTKDVVALYSGRRELPPLEQLLRPVPFVPESLTADRLVRFLQDKRSSKAIVVNEFGGVEGLISVEDVLTEVFGDLGDEIKPEEPGPELLDDGAVRLPGGMDLDDAEEWLGRLTPDSATTVGGLVIEKLGHLPKEGEAIECGEARVEVEAMGPTAVQSVIVRPKPEAPAGAEGEEEPA